MQPEIGNYVGLNDNSTNNSVDMLFDSFSRNVDDMTIECVTSDAITEVVARVKEGEAVSKSPSDLLLKDIKILPKMCKRGCPKGAEKTNIGLPKKRRHQSKLLPFLDRSVDNKDKTILSWLFNPAFVQCVMQGHLIGKDDILLQATSLSMALVDDNVELKLIRRCFTPEGWSSVNRALTNFKQHVSYFCVCSADIGKPNPFPVIAACCGVT